MATTQDYINQLKTDKQTLKTNLIDKGVEVLDTDTFTEMSTKVADITGNDITDFMEIETAPQYYIENIYPNTGLLSILKEIPAIKWTGKYTNSSGYNYSLSNYFLGAKNLRIIDISNFENIDKVESMSMMFYDCEKLEEVININKQDYTSLKYIKEIFNRCISLKNVNNFFQKINNNTIVQCSGMCSDCWSLTGTITIPKNFFNSQSSGVNLIQIFFRCKNCKKIEILSPVVVYGILYAFKDCSNVEEIDIECVDFSKISGTHPSSVEGMFDNCTKLVNLKFGTNLGAGYTASANNTFAKLKLSTCIALSHDSLMDVINKLYDLTANGKNNQQLILGETNIAKLTEEEIAIATNKGWKVS